MLFFSSWVEETGDFLREQRSRMKDKKLRIREHPQRQELDYYFQFIDAHYLLLWYSGIGRFHLK